MASTSIVIETDLDKNLNKAKELINLIDDAEAKVTKLQFIGIEELAKLLNTTTKTAQEYFNQPDFPCTDYGKCKKAEVHAVIKYFSVPRLRKNKMTT